MSIPKIGIKNLPDLPGVYLFRDKRGELLYIGKAVNLRSRVSSYFTGPHDSKTERMVAQIAKIDCRKTDSVLEALILEANLVKKYQPKYNIKLKDDKSFVNIIITKEDFPRLFVSRSAEEKKYEIKKIFGPYTSAKFAREALKIIRKIFPYHSGQAGTEKGCLYSQIGLCPAPYDKKISKADYQKIIKKIELFLSGKKKKIIIGLGDEMKILSKKQEFEKAAEIRNKIFALKHIQDIALITRESTGSKNIPHRIEAYDISNIFGQYATGSMIVFTDGRIDKSQYRKFKIKTIQGADDVGMLKEVLRRRLKHKEWPLPDLIFIDGGIGQFNGVVRVLEEKGLKISVVALAKGPTRRGEKLFSSNPVDIKINLIKEIRDEAHRFAISYHRYLRKRGLMSGVGKIATGLTSFFYLL